MVVKLCTKCQIVIANWTVLDKSTKVNELRSQHHTISALEASADEGCRLCCLFLAGFTNDEIRGLHEEPVGEEMSATISTYPFTFLYDNYNLKGEYTSSASKWIKFTSRLSVEFAERQDCSNQQEVELSTGCYQSLDLAKSWFTSCTESHPACQMQNPEEFDYPTRLLSIGSEVLQLVLASEVSCHATYATLSHCCGKWMPLKLVKDNFTNFRIGISHSELCRTFNDAIFVAKHLGLNYIWIDALCIIQDDPEDWLRESAKMSSVYSCSTINIAATSAKDGTMGCFFKGAWKFRLPIPMREETRFWDFSLSTPFNKFLGEPLLRRAWVFQERFLAPRTLHFTSSQIFWECKGALRCGMFPEREDFAKKIGDPDRFPKTVHLYRHIWHYIVELYSTGMLTYATDRLVAISAVALWLQAQNKDDYLAGIWRKDMERQLCWQVAKHDADSPFLSRPKVYLAPSWSWASILSSVKFINTTSTSYFIKTTLVRILSAHIILEDKNYKFGKVTSGVLRFVVGYLLCGVERTTGLEQEIGSIYTTSGHLILDRARITWHCPKDPRNKLYLLPINSYYNDNKRKPVIYKLDGMILEATDTSKRAEYRRIGYYTYGAEFHGDGDESLYEEFEENGTKLRVINII